MTTEANFQIVKTLSEPALLVSTEGEIRTANRGIRKLLGQPSTDLAGKNLADLVQQGTDEIRGYLANCARSRQMVLGSLTWRGRDGCAVKWSCEGAVVEPWSPEQPGLILLREKAASSKSRFVLLNEKIDQLSLEIGVRKRAEERLGFLAEASSVLARSLDYEQTLRLIADLLVPRLADWCIITTFDEGKAPSEAFRALTVAHKDPDEAKWARDVLRAYPPNPWALRGPSRVIRTGEPELYTEITDEGLQEIARDKDHLAILRRLGLRSAIVVPMTAHGKRFGAVALIRANAGERYGQSDLDFASELARRAALQVANARLFQDAEAARERAEEMSRLKSAFLANMSHEIRTPLTGIIGLSSLLARKIPPEHHTYVQRIEAGGQRLLETLNAVLALAQLEAQQHELELEPLNVARETTETVELFREQIESKGLSLELRVEPDAESARAQLDSGAFSSIIHNLLSNALKYTDKGGIEVAVKADETDITVRITDTGIGIDPDVLPHVFDSFWQESKGWGRSYEGVGIGLSVARRLTEHMRGTIEVESEKHAGSTFSVSFPRALEDAAEEKTAPLNSTATTDPEARPYRLLVVEDNPDTRFFIQTLLKDIGQVQAAVNAEDALELIEGMGRAAGESDLPPFDALVVDINLGAGKNGVELLQILRRDPSFRNVPMAAVTAYAMPGDRERLLGEGFDAYLDKPFTANQLFDIITGLLER